MKRTILIILAFTVVLASCHKDDQTQTTNDKRLMQIAHSTYINEYNDHTQGWAGRSDVIWQDSTIISFEGNTVEYNGDTISMYDHFGNLIRRAYLKDGKVIRVNSGGLYEGSTVAPWFTLTYNGNGEIESVERMCIDCVPTTTTFTWENGNLVQAHKECLNNWNSSDNTYTRDEQYRYYSYDDKNTPLVGLEQYFLIINPEYPAQISKNNITCVRTIASRQYGYNMGEESCENETRDTVETNYRYTYRDNYPISREVEENNAGFHRKDKEYYIYKDGTSASVPKFYTITVIPQSPDHADACGRLEQGGGQYEYGTTALLSTCKCRPVRWCDGSTDNPHSIIVTGDATYTAIFTDN